MPVRPSGLVAEEILDEFIASEVAVGVKIEKFLSSLCLALRECMTFLDVGSDLCWTVDVYSLKKFFAMARVLV